MLTKDQTALVTQLLTTFGVSKASIATVGYVLANDGMTPTTLARRTLGITARTLRRWCEKYGVRRDVRNGKMGSMVDLNGLVKAKGK